MLTIPVNQALFEQGIQNIMPMKNKNNQSKAREDQTPEKLVQEILSIDRKVEDMAGSVLKDPSLRNQFGTESEILDDRLMYLADELKKIDPAVYRSVTEQISESLLDLDFVRMETDMISLRLGQVMEQQRVKLWKRLKLWKFKRKP